jgi:ketosteroid isomerase-like protein
MPRSRARAAEHPRQRRAAPEVDGIELSAHGDQVLFGVRSRDLTEVAGEPLDGEVYNVFTIAEGLIVRMDEFKTREQAVEAMRARHEAL